MLTLKEQHHAFISATFYRELRDGGFDNFRAAFLRATQKYGEERGGRMAQRAIRDGRELDFATYRWYGEWAPTAEYLQGLKGPKTEPMEDGANNTYKILDCPWSDLYLSLGLLDGANAYCSVLDVALARGFNPELTFLVPKTMHANRDYCIQSQVDGKMGAEDAWGPRKEDNMRDWNYHCAHAYWTYAKMIRAIYGPRGEALDAKVLVLLAKEYGQAAVEIITGYADTDFNYI